jgi:hypothetical protein
MQSTCLSGWALLAVSATVALAACTNPQNAAANDPSARAPRIATAASPGGHSVNDVSDALGQRLDAMLSARQTR